MTIPTLDDDRIASMRSRVMLAVDHDITRRGRRARRAVGLVTASVLVLGTGTVGLSMLDMSGSDETSSVADRSSMGGAAAEQDTPSDGAGRDESAKRADGRQVVTTGEIIVTVKDPRDAAQRVSAYVESVDGRVDSRSESGNGDDASAFLTVRVPSTRVTATIERLETYGTVDDVSLKNDDVTAQAEDLDARIDALQISIARLEGILADADTSAELIKTESALTARQEQLESLQAERKRMADQVSLSTLSIDLAQKERAESVAPGGFRRGLTDGWNALVATTNRVVEVAGRLLPWAVVALVLGAAVRLALRRRTTG